VIKLNFNIKHFLKSFLPVLLAASIGTIFVIMDKINYDSLNKPFLNPPPYVFALAWSIIYVLCIVAMYMFLDKVDNEETKQKGVINYYINMFINLLWTVTFFGLGNFIAALVLLILLYLSTLSLFLIYRKESKLVGNLIIPYLLWLLLALYLNICIVFLN
jgi:tryptophan-rich sensory protein